MTESATPGLRRAVWSTILERDVDLALVDLLHTSAPFRAWLLRRVADDMPQAGAAFLGAWHSVNTPNGESDVEAEWHLASGERLLLLVEDKIGAAFQPEQGLRYRQRAENYVASGRAVRVRTLLAAPAGYPARDPDGAAPFDRHLTLEAVLEWCRSEEAGERGVYLAGFMEHAIRRFMAAKERGASLNGEPSPGRGKPQYPDVYAVIHRLLDQRAVGPVLSPSNSTPGEWVYLRFDGREPGVSLRWRLPDHWVELVVSASRVSREALERALGAIPLPGAAVADRGRTEHVVWVPTPEIDLQGPVEVQEGVISEALSVAGTLASWYVAVSGTLEAPHSAEALSDVAVPAGGEQ
jgi:hypothetical protein